MCEPYQRLITVFSAVECILSLLRVNSRVLLKEMYIFLDNVELVKHFFVRHNIHTNISHYLLFIFLSLRKLLYSIVFVVLFIICLRNIF